MDNFVHPAGGALEAATSMEPDGDTRPLEADEGMRPQLEKHYY